MITLPTNIEQNIDSILKSEFAPDWIRSALRLSSEYRAERVVSVKRFVKTKNDVFGYIALRSPSTYSQIYTALSQIKEVLPSWNPKTMLDIGSGPGTAIWAVSTIFPEIIKVTALEREAEFIEVGKRILSEHRNIIVDWKNIDLTAEENSDANTYDIVVISSALNELDDKTQVKILNFAFERCNGVLLITEPGTPFGYSVFRNCAKILEAFSGDFIAPYIGGKYVDSEEVQFSARIKRPDFQKRVRQNQRKQDHKNNNRLLPASDWEESNFYYFAYSKIPSEIFGKGRVIGNPSVNKGYVYIDILKSEAVSKIQILKRDKDAFKLSKKYKPGDLLLDI